MEYGMELNDGKHLETNLWTGNSWKCICGLFETENEDFVTYLEPSLMYSNRYEKTFDWDFGV